MHRVGGLEKEDGTGNVSYDANNHEKMVGLRADKVAKIADFIPEQPVEGDANAEVAVLSWGGTYGSVHQAVKEINANGKKVAHIHLRYINPLPRNLESLLKRFKHVLVCELNQGQMRFYLNGKYSLGLKGYSKVQGKPFKVRELSQIIEKELF